MASMTGPGAGEPRDAYRDALTHVDEHGDVRMVDVSDKAATKRIAVAEGTILMHPETQSMVLEDRAKKGDVLACARVAGIMAAKRASDLIPMCHPLMITKAKVDIEPIVPPARRGRADGAWAPARDDGRVGFHVLATCGVTGVTGIEMEALTAASVACLTIYDMCKAVDRGMEIVDVRLLRKEGGRSGLWERSQDARPNGTADEPVRTAVPTLAFVGYHNSGKTTLLEKVVAELTRRGVRVGTLKHHGHAGFDVDVPGKDSWRMGAAGSRHVAVISPDRYAEYADTSEEYALGDMLARFNDVDVVLVEGYKQAGLPNMVVARSGVDRMRGDDSRALLNERTIAVACNDGLVNRMRESLRPGTPLLDINDGDETAQVVMAWLGALDER